MIGNIENIVGGTLVLGALAFVYNYVGGTKKEVTGTLDELKKHCSEREHSTVRKEECHTAMNNMSDKFKDLQTHIDKRLDDIKELIKRNGNHN